MKYEKINSTYKIKTEIKEKNYQTPIKKLKLTNEFSKNFPVLNCPNTIDNYLIVKRKSNDDKKHQMKNEELITKFQSSNNEQKSKILTSWSQNSNVSFINNSIQNDFLFKKETEESTSTETITKSYVRIFFF